MLHHLPEEAAEQQSDVARLLLVLADKWRCEHALTNTRAHHRIPSNQQPSLSNSLNYDDNSSHQLPKTPNLKLITSIACNNKLQSSGIHPLNAMADPRIHKRQLRELSETIEEIADIERAIALRTTEIARRIENSGDVEEVKQERSGLQATLRTLRLLEGARRVDMSLGRNAAGKWLGKNIGKT